MDFSSWNVFWSSCFGSLAALIVLGNILTIWVFFKQRRRKRAYFLLISLAVADLLVGLFTIPLYMAVHNTQSFTMWLVSTGADVFTGITSIYTLAVISLERMFAIGWPFRHRTLNFRVYIYGIVVPWFVAAIFTTTVFLNVLQFITRESFTFLIFLFQTTPLLVMCVAYYVTWRKQRSPVGNQNRGMAREARLAKTLFLITGFSLLTWLPFQIVNFLVLSNNSVRIYLLHNPAAIITIKLLQFSNSLVNVVIYPFRIPEFKNTLREIFHFCVVPFQRFNTKVAPTAGSGSVLSLVRFTRGEGGCTQAYVLPANFNQETSL